MSKKITVLNGPNLNLLGTREPAIYGSTTLADIDQLCRDAAGKYQLVVECKQSNHEGDLIDWVQQAGKDSAGLIINAGGYTHTSVALHDALRAISVPIIEVHLSDPKTREPFRHHSFVEAVAKETISGKGAQGYVLAIDAMSKLV